RIPKLYDLTWEKPEPLVPRYLCLEVDERTTFRGEIYQPLDEASVEAAAKALLAEEVESVAVCLINSYANAQHEEKVRDILRRVAPGVHVTLSAEVLPEMREYERTSTAVINAYVMPVMKSYVASLSDGMKKRGFTVPLLLMQSNGGIMSGDVASELPMHII